MFKEKKLNSCPGKIVPCWFSLNQNIMECYYPIESENKIYEVCWNKAHKIMIFPNGELTVWSGFSGHGKSQFLGQVLLSFMKQGAKVCAASLEFKPHFFLYHLNKQILGNTSPSREDITFVNEWLSERIWALNLTGVISIDKILESFFYCKQKYGTDVFLIDSFTCLKNSQGDNNHQQEIMEKLVAFKQEHNCQIHLVAHVRKQQNENIIPGKFDIKGSSVISDLADNCYVIWRNKDKERALKRIQKEKDPSDHDKEMITYADCFVRCLKNRYRGREDTFAFWFDKVFNQYLEAHGAPNFKFISPWD